MKRFLSIIAIIALATTTVLATTPEPFPKEQFLVGCAKANRGERTVPCVVIVSPTIYGFDVQLELPRTVTVTNLQRIPQAPASYIPHELAVLSPDANGTKVLRMAMSNQSSIPLARNTQVISFQATFAEEPADNAIINTTLLQESVLFTRDTQNAPERVHTVRSNEPYAVQLGLGLIAFQGLADPPPITGQPPTTTTTAAPTTTTTTTAAPTTTTTTTTAAPDISGAFQFGTQNNNNQGTNRNAATTCFDDDPLSLSAAEWELVCRAKQLGIISGIREGTKIYFKPKSPTNRAEIAKLAFGILRQFNAVTAADLTTMQKKIENDFKTGSRAIVFSDIRYLRGNAPWYAAYVALLSQRGIISGYPDGTFKPENIPNRAEGYRFIVETLAQVNPKIKNLLTIAKGNSANKVWYDPYIEVLFKAKINFSPYVTGLMPRLEIVSNIVELLDAEL
jgi:hypothetical protein